MNAIALNEISLNAISLNYSLAGGKFIREIHLKQPGFTYSACGPFSKIKKENKNLKKQEIQDIVTKMN